MVNFTAFFKSLFSVYCAIALSYNTIGTYSNSKDYLVKFRTQQLTHALERDAIRNDWDAVCFGAQKNAGQRLWDSIIWPVSTIKNVVPAVVLLLNPNPNYRQTH